MPVDDAVLDKNDETPIANLPKQASKWKGKASYTPMAVKVGENYKGILYDFSGNSAYLWENFLKGIFIRYASFANQRFYFPPYWLLNPKFI